MSSMTLTRAAAKAPDSVGLLTAGIDTHKNTHHVAIVDHLGRSVADRQFTTTSDGYRAIIAFLSALGPINRVGVEGTGSYGAGVARTLRASGFAVIEVVRHNRQARRLRGKSDPIDAHQAALSVLAGADAAIAKDTSGHAECLRILVAERRSALKARSQTMNQIHALLISAPDAVRGDYRALHGSRLIETLLRSRPSVDTSAEPAIVARVSRTRLARRHRALSEEIDAIDIELDALSSEINPRLRAMNGVGPLIAATLLAAAGDNPERVATRGAFAALVGVAPMRASSGQRTRHRLSRGGNRQANSAIHRIALLRLRHQEPRTMAYFERRRAEGLTDRDIMRCLKRHIANEVYAALINPAPAEPVGPALRLRRQDHGLTMRDIAARLEVPYRRVQRLETGERADPALAHRVATVLNELEDAA